MVPGSAQHTAHSPVSNPLGVVLAVIEAIPEPLLLTSRDGTVYQANSPAAAILGYSGVDLAGKSLAAVIPAWSEILGSPEPHVPSLARTKAGAISDVEVATSPLDVGDETMILWAIHNTSSPARELEKANEALRRSNEDLNQFAFAASHDLQEPLRMISLYGQLLERHCAGHLTPDADQALAFMITGSQRMEMLLKGLLAYSQAGAGDAAAVAVDSEDVLKKVLFNLESAVRQTDAVVTSQGLGKVVAHEVCLIQIFQNLIGNAIKYRGTEPPAVHVTGERRPEGWFFSVQDNGMGIKPEYSQQVFEIFKRLHGQKYPGTGIGLSICQRLVERYGGKIRVEPAPVQGSRFCFTIPQ